MLGSKRRERRDRQAEFGDSARRRVDESDRTRSDRYDQGTSLNDAPRTERRSGRNRRVGSFSVGGMLLTFATGLAGGFVYNELRHSDDKMQPRTHQEINDACAAYVLQEATERFPIEANNPKTEADEEYDSGQIVEAEASVFITTEMDACMSAEVEAFETQYPVFVPELKPLNTEGN